MKFIDEYRDAKAAREYAHAIAHITTKTWTIMEVCGGQTHAIVKYGVDELLPASVTLLHGPGLVSLDALIARLAGKTRRSVASEPVPSPSTLLRATGEISG